MIPGQLIEVKWEDAELVFLPESQTAEEIAKKATLPMVEEIGYFVAQNDAMLIVAFERIRGRYRDYSCIPMSLVRSVVPISSTGSP